MSSPVKPTTHLQASKSPERRQAMDDEYQTLLDQHTWSLVPQTTSVYVIAYKWVYRLKTKPDGSIDCFGSQRLSSTGRFGLF